MKVILIKDVPGLGKAYDEKNVASGYGRNFLLARGLAKQASPSILAEINKMKSKTDAEKKVREDLLAKNIEDLKEIKITMKEKANELGHLFAGIHKEEIVEAVKKQTHLDIVPDFIDMDAPIKEVGEHLIKVVANDKKAEFILIVEAV